VNIDKVVELKEIKEICRTAKKEGKKIVFTNGCFDIIHPGHIECLKRAKELGDLLVVGVNTDRSVRKIKGKGRPIFNETDRVTILSAITFVDYIVLFDESTPQRLIENIEPDVLVKGGDYTKEEIVGRDVVEGCGGRVVVVPYVRGYSTTAIIDKVKNICLLENKY
jgi:D-beta-D-heptose 7-phosphate kinase/D-beta-D-heptose 1-phosphate adenosyltransferase